MGFGGRSVGFDEMGALGGRAVDFGADGPDQGVVIGPRGEEGFELGDGAFGV